MVPLHSLVCAVQHLQEQGACSAGHCEGESLASITQNPRYMNAWVPGLHVCTGDVTSSVHTMTVHGESQNHRTVWVGNDL